MSKTDKYVERLYNEWKQYGKIIIAVDYDDTISPWRITSQKDIEESGIIWALKGSKLAGAYIVCFTSCNEDRYDEIRKRFKELDIELDSINQNPIALPYGNHNKIYANIFLDDRAGLNESIEILTKVMDKVKGEQTVKNILNSGY